MIRVSALKFSRNRDNPRRLSGRRDEDNDSSWTRNSVLSCRTNPTNAENRSSYASRPRVITIVDSHLDPLSGGLKPDTRYIRASRA